jgi:hypothetical protein
MTIAAGLLQEENIVLAADTLHITGGVPVYGTKLFHLAPRKSLTVSITGSGDSEFMKTIAQKIDKALPESATLDELAKIVDEENFKFHKHHVFKHPSKAEDKPEYDLLIAASAPYEKKLCLFKTTRGAFFRVDTYEFIGIGAPVANAFANGIYGREMPLIEAECFALYGIHQAKKFDPNCGGDTQAVVIQLDGRRTVLSNQYIKRAGEYFDAFTQDFKELVLPSSSKEFESEYVLGNTLKHAFNKWIKMRDELRKIHDEHFL